MQQNPQKPLRIGIVGAGSIVRQRHLPGLAALAGVEITAVSNSTFQSSARFCREHLPSATPMENWADLVGLPELDIVWVGTGPNMHAPVTVSALEAGKHVFCQARMAMNLAEAEEMLAASAARPHLVTMLCPPPHGMKGDALFQRLLQEEIGDIYHLRLQSFSPAFLSPANPVHWRQRREISGLNIMTLGIYTEVLQRWLGPIETVAASARTVIPVREGYQVEIPDILSVLATFTNGIHATLEFSSVAAFAGSDSLEVYGSKGKLVYDFGNDEILFGPLPSSSMRQIDIPDEETGTWDVEARFIKAVRNPAGERPHPDFTDGVQYMRVVQGVADSLEQACSVRVA